MSVGKKIFNFFNKADLTKHYSTSSHITVTDPIKPVKIRWFYATDIPNTKPYHPEYKLLKRPTKFLPFTKDDSNKIEDSYLKFLNNDNLNPESKFRYVNVNEDGLFNVDLLSKIIKPTYWIGPSYEIRRGIWFLDNLPLPDLLSEQIELKYKKYRPDFFLKDSMKDENFKLPPILIKSEREIFESKSKDKYSNEVRQWPYHEFDDLSEVPKLIYFKSDNLALLVNKGQLLPHFLLDNFAGYSNSIFGIYSIKRGYEEKNNQDNENLNKEGKSADQIDNNKIINKMSKIKEIEDEQEAKLEENENSKLIKEDKNGNFFTETNKKFQNFMENDFSNDNLITENKQNRQVDHLILCVHGIGQSLSSKYASINFAHDCNHMRQLLKSEFVKKSNTFVPLAYNNNNNISNDNEGEEKNCKVQILPIVWRYNIDFGLDYIYNEFDKNGQYRLPKLSDLNIDAVTPIRNLTADVLLDILLFYEPKFKKEILESVTESANSIYDKYLKNHPNFKGKVSLIGHSLGSAIVLDILDKQPDIIPKGKEFNPKNHLKFEVENYFGFGSPNGVFKFLKRENIFPRSMKEEIEKNNDNKIVSAVYPKVKNLYNVFYATDLVAYRLEPLINTKMSKIKPKRINSIYEDNIITNKIKDISKSSPEFLSNPVVKTIVENTVTWKEGMNTDIFSGKETELNIDDDIKKLLFGLNKNGRVDYVLPQGMFDIDIINAVGSHIQYFDDSDVADFILDQLWRKRVDNEDEPIFGIVSNNEDKQNREKEKKTQTNEEKKTGN